MPNPGLFPSVLSPGLTLMMKSPSCNPLRISHMIFKHSASGIIGSKWPAMSKSYNKEKDKGKKKPSLSSQFSGCSLPNYQTMLPPSGHLHTGRTPCSGLGLWLGSPAATPFQHGNVSSSSPYSWPDNEQKGPHISKLRRKDTASKAEAQCVNIWEDWAIGIWISSTRMRTRTFSVLFPMIFNA